MIVHVHKDGSEGYQYEIGDRVIVERTIHGGWFDYGPTRSADCNISSIESRSHWRVAIHYVRYSQGWGPASCFPWTLKPHPDTIASAKRIKAEP